MTTALRSRLTRHSRWPRGSRESNSTEEPSSSQSQPPSEPPPPSTAELTATAVKLIVSETSCTSDHAKHTLSFIAKRLAEARDCGGTCWMDHSQALCGQYQTFRQVIPHGMPSSAGSAHEAIERALLDSAHGEFGIRHDGDGEDEGGFVFCSVEICISRVR